MVVAVVVVVVVEVEVVEVVVVVVVVLLATCYSSCFTSYSGQLSQLYLAGQVLTAWSCTFCTTLLSESNVDCAISSSIFAKVKLFLSVFGFCDFVLDVLDS